MTSATSATSEGAQGIFPKVTFLKSVYSKEKYEACLGFLVKIFTKSLHRGGVGLFVILRQDIGPLGLRNIILDKVIFIN